MSYPTLKPNQSWFTPTLNTTKRNLITVINIVDSHTPSDTIIDSWDASLAQDGSIMCYLNGTTLTIAGNGSGKIMANEDASCMFSDSGAADYFSSVTVINGLSMLDTSEAYTMAQMFTLASQLKTLDIENFDTRNSTSFRSMFHGCSSIEELNLSSWNTGKVESLHGTFNGCSSLKSLNVSTWDVSNVTTMYGTFNKCNSLTELDVSDWNTEKVQDLTMAFASCKSLISLDVSRWNVSSSISLERTFTRCEAIEYLDISKWNVSSVSNYYGTFTYCGKLKELDLSTWNVSSATTMKLCFKDCQSLEKLNLSSWNTKNVTSFKQMFQGCVYLKELDLSNFDTANSDSMYNMFDKMYRLERITVGSKFNFCGNGSSTARGNFVAPSSDYIPNADGKWYLVNGTAYAPGDIPSLTAATYYATLAIAVWDVDSKKYMHLAAMRVYHDLLNADIDTKFDTFREELGDYDISVSATQTKASTEYTEEDAEIWIFNCGTSTVLV